MFQEFTGKQYLQIDVANQFGLDKKTWDKRLAWFKDNESNLENLARDADEPSMYMSSVRAWRNSCKGNPNHHPISLDATSSGIQLLACLTGDRKAAELCNVVDVGSRQDAYTTLYTSMCEQIGESAKIKRDDTKKAVMTAFYGSEAVPKRVFGEGQLLAIFEETMEAAAPGAWELNKAMLDLWNPEATRYQWVMPDNFHVNIKIMRQETAVVHFLNKPYDVNYTINAPVERGRSLGANMTHSVDSLVVREMIIRCNYNFNHIQYLIKVMGGPCGTMNHREKDELVKILWGHYEDCGFLSARILDYLDRDNIGLVDRTIIFDLIATLPLKPFEVIAIHDCYRCLPNYGNDLRKQYNIILSAIAKSNLLSFLLSQITGRVVTVGKLDPELYKDVLNANYALS